MRSRKDLPRPKVLGKGLGHQLINFAVSRAEQQNKQYLWLGVWEDNQPALKFYNKMGFSNSASTALIWAEISKPTIY
ncbi:GNAT family N-acetyltransferase [Psychromonas sp. KJ10-2]|uniref:GNAT family N-acetyltransferase n=1 Tax=Psychromonas sp. KJ10-2 TaxID=3391822 RepID=UPI0039B59945